MLLCGDHWSFLYDNYKRELKTSECLTHDLI